MSAKYWEKMSAEEQEEIKEQIRKQNEYDEFINEYELWCREQKKCKRDV